MNKNLIKGGKVIASGGFGCIFKPALHCINEHEQSDNDSINISNHNKISKLMSAKHAKDEYQQIQQFKSILHVIPNYEHYFLLNNITLCKPKPLTNEDLIRYDKKCKALTKKNIKSNNVNQSLEELLGKKGKPSGTQQTTAGTSDEVSGGFLASSQDRSRRSLDVASGGESGGGG